MRQGKGLSEDRDYQNESAPPSAGYPLGELAQHLAYTSDKLNDLVVDIRITLTKLGFGSYDEPTPLDYNMELLPRRLSEGTGLTSAISGMLGQTKMHVDAIEGVAACLKSQLHEHQFNPPQVAKK